jgi:hypothetical protein
MLLDRAMKDPIGVNLDRNQIVKGWVDKQGKVQERVCDMAWSGDRKPGKDGKLPPVGNTVDVADTTWTNTIGAPELIAVWKDPDFDPSLRAFYYGRVIEIPTPRWTAYAVRTTARSPSRERRWCSRNAPTRRRSGTSPDPEAVTKKGRGSFDRWPSPRRLRLSYTMPIGAHHLRHDTRPARC